MLSEEGRAKLEELAKKWEKTIVCLDIPGGEGLLLDFAGPPGLRVLELWQTPMRDIRALVAEFGDEQQRDHLLSIAHKLSEQGVKARMNDRYPTAVGCLRFALAVVLHYQEWNGVTAVTANQWSAVELLDEVVHVGEGGRIEKPPMPPEQLVAYFRRQLAEDAGCYAHEIAGWASECLAEPATKFGRMLGLHRLAAWAGDSAVRARLLAAMVERRDSTEDIDGLVACLEDVCRMDMIALWLAAGVPLHDGEGRQAESPLADVFPAFLRVREGISDLSDLHSAERLAGRYRVAFHHLQSMRLLATSGGGTFGHVQSYRLSQLLQPVGRDLTEVLLRLGKPVDALAVAEELHARALVDWMARSHHTNRLVRLPWTTGSLNAVRAAGAGEIRQCAQENGAPIVFFLELQAGYHVWVQRTDGRVISALAAVVPEQIERVIARLQRTPAGDGRGSLTPDEGADDDGRPLSELLAELFVGLFPPEIREALQAEGERLVVVPDSLLEYLPFCALRMDDGRYLLERFELTYWPSVTVWLLTQTSADVRRSAGGALREMNRFDRFTRPTPAAEHGGERTDVADPGRVALVFGAPTLERPFVVRERGRERTLRFGALAGAETEARRVAELLECKPLLAGEATRDAFVRLANVVPVVHFATHGYLSTVVPERSLLALSDEPLEAGSLYFEDRPIAIELVVMSACQTGLGSQHPDSVIGLTNAFLVAGANAVVSTLWAIDDLSTVDLMVRFYEALRSGASVAAALRSAQLASLPREPCFWAAFKLTGSSSNPLPDRLRAPA